MSPTPQQDRPTLAELEHGLPFAERHIGPRPDELARMLEALGVDSLDALAGRALPDAIRDPEPVGASLPAPENEAGMLAELRELADRNTVTVPMIGLGYHGTRTPSVIRRNVLENPAWYTAYTPYQPEISQGRLEALLAFQTMVSDLTGLPVAGASLLDEATAAAEAMTLLRRAGRSKSPRFVVDADTLPQTLDVLRTRAEPLGIELVVTDLTGGLPDGEFFGALLSYPGASGRVADPSALVAEAHERGALVAVASDLLSLTLLTPPGEFGADAAVGSTQRFGVPLGFGGPHAAYLSVGQKHARQLPGRLVGVSRDADGNYALRLALQTREQHIRREKATSNICTAQVLLAVMAACYGVYHGPEGLRSIATRTHRMAAVLAGGLREGGVEIVHDAFFDTLLARVPGRATAVVGAAHDAGIALRQVSDDEVGVSTSEITTVAHLQAVWEAFGVTVGDVAALDAATADAVPGELVRTSEYLTHRTFHEFRSETALMRWLRRLADADLALDRAMIPLGSCTMKLNAAAEMEAVTWPQFSDLHPFAPEADTAGSREMITQLEGWLADLTGYAAVSLQPNAGSQGELAGLLAIAAYHRSRGDGERDVCLIPASAHGTNAASAIMAGMRVVVVGTDAQGDVDLADLRSKIAEHGDRLAALMITYPSTHGVYEAQVRDVCGAVHDAGGQVYVDGANLNALVGVARPGAFGGDVSHLNLHKTFCIPHGGGGPGVGPVAVAEHLVPFLPGRGEVGPVSAARYGSPGVLPISWAYLRMMGLDGLRRATLTAVAAANYVAKRLAEHYPVLYSGTDGAVAHECILDLRTITKDTGVTVDDVAKRLIDHGIHAPTMSFPVAGTLMVEPTESEDLPEIERFVQAMISIKGEIDRVAAGEWPADDNPLRNAPHTAACLADDKWDHPYPRELAAYPAGQTPGVHDRKVWPPVRRIDGAHGDRNLVCSCPPPEAFA
ncbi:Glycine dehydrogenase [decarboxylating] (glycine cleavage system P protein) [Pseudonocardia sp. Ae168_Ps1]|uniref:aminomethyl-transferring glycine dehydrogenase n=1 Tax=unclassified Pseudonocardia TaxID=2619320 RepID=UPI00094B5AC2|nr:MULTISPECIES: aminomethyl-transferring glycine dehydrogenase [unclassified Pseudonocardia]OLL71938.1 Glycine dehydrogenase [decarboxylating] (glycine cleavage system P protein) [Pseudonocardia sp. Ae150A_Ps1]OLL77905.1 Glycine dehydrogenase [decarboxylating] (glycine cleavage system P protein) [Pseudonocardia sp. Ae168_Ps1]OLL87972.1 Glycine dehydrogenase [decarboxylating] (glycine cleavage system P protein) [Pseudonocardia sp. Ae263_Ps1]OLL92003.1 Glycine dehydrogenase [decarboxylating] (gl